MLIYIDSANLEEIKEANELGILNGVTTNPTLIFQETKRTGKKHKEILKEICNIIKGDVSAEVLSLDSPGMIAEAEVLSKIASNIVIKIPITKSGLVAIKKLSFKRIRTNATLCFSPLQALLVAKAGANFVSPFIGRLDDISEMGINLVVAIRQIFLNYNVPTKIIVASIRNPLHILDSARIGADIVTLPFNVIQKLLKHPLTDIGIENFIKDSKEEIL